MCVYVNKNVLIKGRVGYTDIFIGCAEHKQ